MKPNTQEIKQNNFVSEVFAADLTHSVTAVVRYQAIKEHLCCELNGESVILSLKNGKYYGLNSVASRIWELIQLPLSVAEIESAILLEYEVENQVCEQAVSVFLKQMIDEELILSTNEKVPDIF